jgi:tetratricopeptide (TPR) repeat protein
VNPDPTRSHSADPRTHTFDPDLDAGLAAAFGTDPTPGGWSRPPLLRDDPSDHAPLVQPASPQMPRQSPDRYQLLGEVAHGGMGVILKGRDPDLGRDLAVKVLKAELAGRPAAVQRFVEEAQVGGQLQHPGVVPVYDLGRFADGRPYFAMKLVKGRTLADLLTERLDPSADRGRFLQVFLQVCQTVAYAHSRGVIHRDLKPANVMVGSFGEVLVMDWGLAKVLPRSGVADEERASQASRERPRPEPEPTVIQTARSGSGSDTAAGSVMGTPAFMSPEQAGGEIDKLDERADVFGLGAVLCVILTGRPPYAGNSPEAVRLMATRGELDDAFARLDGCRADAELVALCKRCLGRRREARPRHAGEVAGEVAAHLADVEARAHAAEVARAAAAAEAREQRKRRRVQAALGVAFTALVVLGGAFGWWRDRRAAAEQARLGRNAEAVADLAGRCEAALRADDAGRAAAALAEIDRRLGEGGAEAVRARVDRCRSDLAVLRDLDNIDQVRWTPVENKIPDPVEDAALIQAAFARYGVIPGETPADEVARRVADSSVRDRLVGALDQWLRGGQSESVRAVLRAVDADRFRDAVRDAVLTQAAPRVRDLAGGPEALAQPVWFLAFLGESGAVPVERRRELLAAALQRRPADLGVLMALGQTYPHNQREGAQERVRWFQAAVAVQPGNVAARDNLGVALSDTGDRDGAIACYREAIRLDPRDVFAHYNLALSLTAKGDVDGAIASYRKAVRVDPTLAKAHYNLGVALQARGDVDGAIACYREAIKHDPNYVLAHYNLGLSLTEKRDADGAIACHREAIRLDPGLGRAHSGVGAVLCDLKKDYDGAIACFRKAIRLDPTYAAAHFNLGNALYRKGDLDGAITSYR